MRLKRHITALGLIAVLMCGTLAFAKLTAEEANIKAAVLFNLIRFSVWDKDTLDIESQSIQLCTQTTPTLQNAMSGLEGKLLKGKSLMVKHLNLDELNYDRCNILFVSHNIDASKINYDALHNSHILTIGDNPEQLRDGAGMSVQRQGKKIRFSINKKTMRKAGITPSSKILNLAVGSK